MTYLPSTSCGEIGKILHIIYNKIMPYKTDGLFIEIGANDGKTGSFTYNLGKIGWYGINIEPIPRLYNLCCNNHKDHKNVKNYNLALGELKGEVKFCLMLLNQRFGEIDSEILERVKILPVEQLENLGAALFNISEVADLITWLNQQDHQ